MAVIKKRVDDILHAQGKDVEATGKTRVIVPGSATPTGKPVRLDLDVSEQGKATLDKMVRAAEEATAKAWEPLLALKPRPAPKKAAEQPPVQQPEQAAPDEQSHFPAPDERPQH